ncbi:hypothetical protein G7048_26270 (plasmid) [Diaphorobacter sp. HDW4B]|uniref:hypothetical protein n=1 Tax=Diaphorobacter sp. HDW4B TaxID=2714925 RepID=UPI00140C6A88|nr:hypothetical protein [Diaphorobacter sp. HDW4B]QIL73998.1 hypothetical protein G7048_26270 [Diaphorobacter sp. HDW4B]
MTYDPNLIFQSLDQHVVVFIAIGSLAMVFNYLYFYFAAQAARRDKVPTFPLACTTIWFAHDLSFVLMFDQWFNVYDHWYVKLFWVALIPTTLIELGYIYQTYLYGKKEILPNGSQKAYLAFVALSVLAGLVGWYSLKQFLDDPIYAYTFGSTGFMAPVFVLAKMARRGDAKGQSEKVWAAYTAMQLTWFSCPILFFGPAFREPWYLIMAATSVAGGLILTGLCIRMRRPSTNAHGVLAGS